MKASKFLLSILVFSASACLAAKPIDTHRSLDNRGVRIPLGGEVLIQNNGPNTVVAFVQPQAPGALLERVSITAAVPFSTPMDLHLREGSVETQPSFITIRNVPRRLEIVFALVEAAVPAAREGYEQTVLRGYWLGYRLGVEGHTIASVKRDPKVISLFCDASIPGDDCMNDGGTGTGGGGGGGGALCSSGGPGASSCSCSSGGTLCSVSCSSGSYACCRNCDTLNPTCICLSN
jgi:hypothetical protein